MIIIMFSLRYLQILIVTVTLKVIEHVTHLLNFE